jgi:hypothetical protein
VVEGVGEKGSAVWNEASNRAATKVVLWFMMSLRFQAISNPQLLDATGNVVKPNPNVEDVCVRSFLGRCSKLNSHRTIDGVWCLRCGLGGREESEKRSEWCQNCIVLHPMEHSRRIYTKDLTMGAKS